METRNKTSVRKDYLITFQLFQPLHNTIGNMVKSRVRVGISQKKCAKSGDFVENKDELQITTRQIPLPSIVSITEMITTYLVSGDIRRRTISTCYGCSVDHPSQLQHMDNGCMMDWEDAVTQYYEEAFACVTLDDVVEACNKIITVLDLSMSLLDQVICVPEVKMHVLQVGIPQDFELLFKYVLM